MKEAEPAWEQEEEASIESEMLFRKYFDFSLTGISAHRISDSGPERAVHVNDSLLNMLGYSREEFLGLPLLEILEQEERDRAPARIKELKEKGKLVFELNFITKLGQSIPSVCQLSLLDIQGQSFAIASVTDITERKQAEEALQQSEKMLQRTNDRLVRMVEERTAELLKANNQLSQEIEKRRKTEEGLRRSEEKYRNLIERANDGIIILQAGRVKFVNQRLADLLGYTREEMTGTSDIRYVHPEMISESTERTRRRIAGGVVETAHENILRHKDGADIDVEVNAVTILFEGKISNLVFVRDVTERKRAEASLRESKKRYRMLLENALVGVFRVTREGKFLMANRKMANIFGYDFPEEFLEAVNNITALYVRPEERGKNLQELDDKGFLVGKEIEFKTKNGNIIWVKVDNRITTSKDGIRVYEGMLEDITEHKQAQEALKESQERYHAIFEQAANSIVLVDAETGDLVEFNDMAHESLGFTREEFKKLKISDFEVIESDEEIDRHIKKIVNEGSDHFETKHKTKGGEIRAIHVSSRAVYIRGQDFIQSIWHDITERKQFEAALKKSQQELRRLANKLITAQEVERQRLARELHDDIAQRLAVLSIEAGKIEQRLNTTSDRSFDKFRQMQDELVNLSLDIHAISHRLHPSILEDLGLSDAIKSESDAIIKREGMVINYAPGSVPPDLSKDVALCLYRILQEGLRNIVKHACATESNIYLSCQKNEICLSIEDNGQGFDLYRMDKKPGLGLSSMEERIRFIGGNFNIRSQPGEGTRIVAKAPLKIQSDRSTVED